MGGIATLEQGYEDLMIAQKKRLRPTTIPYAMPSTGAFQIANLLGVRGPSTTISVACGSSALAIVQAARLIAGSEADIVLAGGVESIQTPAARRAWQMTQAVSPVDASRPQESCRPFSARRSGFPLAEGAACLLLESEASARRRGAPVLEWIRGAGHTTDAGHISRPDRDAQVQAIRQALARAGVAPSDIGYINAHGTATQAGDLSEAQAISRSARLTIRPCRSVRRKPTTATLSERPEPSRRSSPSGPCRPAGCPVTPPKDPTRYVIRTPEVIRAQRRHARLTVMLPAILLIAGPWVLPAESSLGVAIASFAIMVALVGGFGISVGFHRLFAHRSFRTGAALRAMLAIAGQMAGQGPVIYWVALHRRHHAYPDLPGDPHSPSPRAWPPGTGPWKAFWLGHFGWATNHAVPPPGRYAPDLVADPVIRRVNGAYHACLASGYLLPAVGGWLWTGDAAGAITGFWFGGVLRSVIATQAIWAINSGGHRFGSRPHDTGDFSTNCRWLVPLSFGECWHNNHHHAPASARFGHHWTEPDPGWWIIVVLLRLRLVSDVRTSDELAPVVAEGDAS